MATLKNTNFNDTGSLKLPSGTTGQRPSSPQAGMIRYNTTIRDTEYYDGTAWRSITDVHPEATGGTITDTEHGGVPYRVHVFTSVGTTNFVATKGGEVEYLIVAGGGSGGSGRHAGGGGAGGLVTGFTTITPGTYPMVVGSGGGAAGANGSSTVAVGNNGGNSSAFGLTALGGGFGGGHPHGTYANNIEAGRDGGSGGGGAHGSAGGGNIGGTGLQPGSASGGFGNNGTGATNRSRCGAGGGAGSAPIAGFGGETDTRGQGDSGGIGIYSTILGNGYYFAGGGGSSGSPSTGSGDSWLGGHGGVGGGGGGASNGDGAGAAGGVGGLGYNQGETGRQTTATGVCDGGNAGANTGGGGGGAAGWGSTGNGRGGDGGSGIVVVRYRRNESSVTAPAFIRRGMLGGSSTNPGQSAYDIMRNNPGAPSGSYWINWGGTAYKIHCEMELEGGGWMMVMNYVKGRGNNPNLLVRTSSFPQLGTENTLTTNESGSTGTDGTWGHISNSLAAQYNWNEYMFYGRTTFHGRVVHWVGSHQEIIRYIKTGSGSMVPYYGDEDFNRNASLYNNATIPLFVTGQSGFSNQGDSAMTNFPIYGNSTIGNPRAHWATRGLGDRWEMDDYAGTQGAPTNYDPSTIHRIWVR